MKQEYGLIGYPLGHSFSPEYFTRFFGEQAIEASYEAFPLQQLEELPTLVKEHPLLCGLNVTQPYKEAVLAFVSELSPEVQAIGAANVLKIKRDAMGKPSIQAYNSDYLGFKQSLEGFLPVGDSTLKALVFGTGGAARAVCYALEQIGIPYLQVSRHPQDGQIAYSALRSYAQSHRLWINATPIGLCAGEALGLPYQMLSPEHYCYDLIYNPSPSEYLKRASSYGAQTKDGLEMLHRQADEAWRIWTEYE